MKRREFITLLGGAATWPLAARAQQPPRMAHLGILMGIANDSEGQARLMAFRDGLRQLGWEDGKNLQIDERWGAGDEDRIKDDAAGLVRLKPDLIFVNGARALAILQQNTSTIPIVMVATNDPGGGGFTASLARPAGNVTGFTQFELSLLGKMLALLKQAAPQVKRVGVMVSPNNPNVDAYLHAVQAIETDFLVKTESILPEDVGDIEPVIERFSREPNDAILLPPDVFVIAHRLEVISASNRHGVPTVASFRHFAAAGALMSYGTDLPDLYRRAAGYVDRILKGEKPADLPVQAPTKYELIINLKTAKALGLTVPTTLLATADEVIE